MIIPDYMPSRVFLPVFLRTLILIICITGLSSASLLAQDEEDTRRRGSRIIDDTTREVYGPRTSRYYFERDVFYNREQYFPIDTVIRNFHHWNYVQRYNNLYQDLGNIGTSILPIYYHSPDIIGVNSGFQSYDLYWTSEEVKYFDTKSPYTNLKVDLGGKGRSITHVTFSRNINPRWNFGFNFRAIFVDKQIQRRGKGDRNVRSYYYDAYTAYQTKDSTYRLFFNFRRMYYEVAEYGGVDVPPDYRLSDFFTETIQPQLTEAASNDLRTNLHLFHQYKIGRGLQLYHQFDQYGQDNKFIDNYGAEPNKATYFDHREIITDSTYDAVDFKTTRNEVGMKGSLLKLFYNGYYAVRNFNMTYNRLLTDTLAVETKGAEIYLGGRISLKLDSLVEVNGWAEVQQTGNFRIEGEIKSKWFDARLKQVLYEPTFVQQAYRGSHDVWNNSFDKVESTMVNGYLHYRSPWFFISPGLTFTRIRNYVYFRKEDVSFGQDVLPVQSEGNHIYTSPEVSLGFTILKHISLSGRGIYTRFIENERNAIRLPDLFINAELSYSNIFFNGNLDMHGGVDVHWKSDYFAPGYDPVIRQFYNQDSFRVPDFPIIDVFLNAKIKKGRIYIKYHNLVQLFTKQGYLPTPYYIGQKNIVDFGFDWSFYD